MLGLMARNVSSEGIVFTDPFDVTSRSLPGCVIAAPSYPADVLTDSRNYVVNRTHDAAVAAIEIAASNATAPSGWKTQALHDYAAFARACLDAGAPPTAGNASYTVAARSASSLHQSDGPAMQTIALLRAFPQLDEAAQKLARHVVATNLDWLLAEYRQPTTDLMTGRLGYSFFARAVQCRCFREVLDNDCGITVPPGLAAAAAWLRDSLNEHWDGTHYTSLVPVSVSGALAESESGSQPYDPNIGVVMASVYGGVPFTDTKLLATAGRLIRQWADVASATFFPVNPEDGRFGVGPMLGRYPGDSYDGDISEPGTIGHPWPACTCNFAELCYGLAHAICQAGEVPFDSWSADFFAGAAVAGDAGWRDAALALEHRGDMMLRAVVRHSDNLELGEQVDAITGYGKSIRNLTVSYAAFSSAVRRRSLLAHVRE